MILNYTPNTQKMCFNAKLGVTNMCWKELK